MARPKTKCTESLQICNLIRYKWPTVTKFHVNEHNVFHDAKNQIKGQNGNITLLILHQQSKSEKEVFQPSFPSILKCSLSLSRTWKGQKNAGGDFPRSLGVYTASQKHESTLLHTYVLNEFLTADCSCKQNIFEKTHIVVGSWNLYASFGTFCVQISRFCEEQWVSEHSEESRNRRHFLWKQRFIDVQAFFKSSLWLE